MRQLIDRRERELSCGNIQTTQQMLHAHFERLAINDIPEFSRQMRLAEAQWLSQNGEDGILLFLLARIGLSAAVPPRSAEVGAGDGWENNTINLAAHRGFDALLIDPSWALENLGRPLMAEYPTLAVRQPTIRVCMVEPDELNDLFIEAGFDGPLGVLSIDVDGNDFWMWRALTVADPLVVIMELNTQLGQDVAWTMPYERGYNYWSAGREGHLGASAAGYDRLARERGFVFAGCDRLGVNGFWVKRGLIPELGDGVPLSYIWESTSAQKGSDSFATLRDALPWVEVTDAVVAQSGIADDPLGRTFAVRPART